MSGCCAAIKQKQVRFHQQPFIYNISIPRNYHRRSPSFATMPPVAAETLNDFLRSSNRTISPKPILRRRSSTCSQRSVSFDTVEVREYDRTVGDNVSPYLVWLFTVNPNPNIMNDLINFCLPNESHHADREFLSHLIGNTRLFQARILMITSLRELRNEAAACQQGWTSIHAVTFSCSIGDIRKKNWNQQAVKQSSSGVCEWSPKHSCQYTWLTRCV